jgi:hypothetical protein
LISILLVAPAAGKSQDPVVPPGQEKLLANMLGLGATLPGSCTFAGGQADGPVVRGTYDCATGEIVIELLHPSKAPWRSVRTDQFALTVLRGSPAPEFLQALQSRIRSQEAAFEWKLPSPPPRLLPTPKWVLAGQLLFSLLIAGVMLAFWRLRTHIVTREAMTPALLAALALAFRLIAHAAPADIRAVLDERVGPQRAGWGAFLHLVYGVLPQQDETIWTINRIAGAVSVPLLYVLMRKRFADPVAAVAGAAALAVNPLITRYSASDTPYVLVCAALLGALVAYDRYRESGSIGTMVLALGLLTAAMQLRPDAPWLIVPAALLVLARPLADWRTLLRPAAVIAALAFVALNGVLTVWAVTGHTEGGYWRSFVLVGSLMGSPWATSDMTPEPLAALVVFGALSALFYKRPGVFWLAAALVADPIHFPAYDSDVAGQYSNARYHIPAMYLTCGLAGLGVASMLRLLAWLARRPVPAASLAAAGIVCLASASRFDLLRRMWTPQREYELFRDGLKRLDPDCRVVTLAHTRDSGWAPFDYLVPDGLLDIPQFLEGPQRGCFIYYRTGNCYTPDLAPYPERAGFEMIPACRAIEERFQLEPIVEAQVPAIPYRGEIYARDPLPLGFYRLREVGLPRASGQEVRRE